MIIPRDVLHRIRVAGISLVSGCNYPYGPSIHFSYVPVF
jgi:hypothetical protein